MLALIMPVGLGPLIGVLYGYQRKAKKAGYKAKMKKITVYEFCSELDLGGMTLFSGGLALVLLPATLAGTLEKGWETGWVIACLVLGALMLIALPPYEYYLAKHPIVPPYYLRDLTITIALIMYTLDSLALGVTHSYFYTWLIVARGYKIRNALFIYDANRAMQWFTGLVMGGLMWWTRKYKWIIVAGSIIRMIGYGVMFRIRHADNPTTGEIVVVQMIQGFGTGLVGTGCFVAATVSVPHKEIAQITALAVCLSTLGSTIGTAIGGGIYTNHFKQELVKELGSNGTAKLIATVFDSITAGLPAMGTPQRQGISRAVGAFEPILFSSYINMLQYNTTMGYFTYVGFGSTVPGLILSWFLPNRVLTYVEHALPFHVLLLTIFLGTSKTWWRMTLRRKS